MFSVLCQFFLQISQIWKKIFHFLLKIVNVRSYFKDARYSRCFYFIFDKSYVESITNIRIMNVFGFMKTIFMVNVHSILTKLCECECEYQLRSLYSSAYYDCFTDSFYGGPGFLIDIVRKARMTVTITSSRLQTQSGIWVTASLKYISHHMFGIFISITQYPFKINTLNRKYIY